MPKAEEKRTFQLKKVNSDINRSTCQSIKKNSDTSTLDSRKSKEKSEQRR